jgi:hypothetical protein
MELVDLTQLTRGIIGRCRDAMVRNLEPLSRADTPKLRL